MRRPVRRRYDCRVTPAFALVAGLLQAAEPTTAFALDPYLETGLLAGDAVLLGGALIAEHAVTAPQCPCREDGIWAIDRPALEYDSAPAGTASDVLQDFLIVAAPLGLAAAGLPRGAGDAATLAVISLESLALSATATQLVKNLAVRPRPTTYPISASSRSAYQSFWSGHTAVAFTAATSSFLVLHAEYPREAWPWVVGATAEAMAVSVGILRVASGQHFPTDVMAAAAAGTVFGWFVPFLHQTRGPVSLAVQPEGIALAIRYE
jgi:membrane-associated phospholipid phosphatase